MRNDASRAVRVANGHSPAPMSVPVMLAHFGIPTVGLFLTTHLGIPALIRLGAAPMFAWYTAGLVVFIPLFIAALVRAGREMGTSTRASRLWLQRPSRSDLASTGIALLVVIAASGILFGGAGLIARAVGLPAPGTQPPFLRGLDVTRGCGSPSMLAAWVPFFFFNIAGEELFWRGYILPRQERAIGRWAWVVNGSLWAVFHLAFGWSILLMLAPIFVVLPWLVQRRRNVWLGIVLHGVYNGAPSLLLALGVLG